MNVTLIPSAEFLRNMKKLAYIKWLVKEAKKRYE